MKKFMIFLITLAMVGGCSEGNEPNPEPPIIPPQIEDLVKGTYEIVTINGDYLPDGWIYIFTFGPDMVTLDDYDLPSVFYRQFFKVEKWYKESADVKRVRPYTDETVYRATFNFLTISEDQLEVEFVIPSENERMDLVLARIETPSKFCWDADDNDIGTPIPGTYDVYEHFSVMISPADPNERDTVYRETNEFWTFHSDVIIIDREYEDDAATIERRFLWEIEWDDTSYKHPNYGVTNFIKSDQDGDSVLLWRYYSNALHIEIMKMKKVVNYNLCSNNSSL